MLDDCSSAMKRHSKQAVEAIRESSVVDERSSVCIRKSMACGSRSRSGYEEWER